MIAAAAPDTPRRPATGSRRPWLIGILLFLCIFSGYLLSYNVDKPTHNADWYIRYQVTCSIVERNDFYIHPYQNDGRTGPGVNGLKYAQYTLGQSVALIPLYLLGRVFAGVSHTNCDQTIAVPQVFLAAKLLDLILGALLCVLFFGAARWLGYGRPLALALTFLLAFGTALWPDVLSNLEHTQESLFLLAAAYAAMRYTMERRHNRLWVLTMGAAAGLVFLTRVAGLIALPIFAAYLLLLHRHWSPANWRRPWLRDLALYTAGTLPSIVINAAYDTIRFGAPWRTGPYPDHSLGYPPWLGIPNLLISPGKGLFWYVPALLLLPFVVQGFRRRYPLVFQLFCLICGVYLAFYATVFYWHGDPAWGPRYLYALLPYLVLPLGELFRRWRGLRLSLRGLVVGVLAASFLVQFTAVTVSYWRHWELIYGYHYDQVENHQWGQNLNYWWYPDQSPLVFSLTGIYTITQKYVTHAPLLQHPAAERLSNPYESCVYAVLNQADPCLGATDKLRYSANWNTFTMWWVHTFPWWDLRTVVTLALLVLAVFILSGAALLTLVLSGRPGGRAVTGVQPAGDGATGVGIAPAPAGSNGHTNGHGPHLPDEIATMPELVLGHATDPLPGRGGILVAEAQARPLATTHPATTVARSITGLVPLGMAALAAAGGYLGIMGVAVATAPARAAPLLRTVPMSAVIHDGTWQYQARGIQQVPALPGSGVAPPPAHHYAIVTLHLHNLLTRPAHVRPEYFALTDARGLAFPLVYSAFTPVAALSHLMPIGSNIPPHGAADQKLVYLIRDDARDLKLIGPGLTVIPLQPVAR